jgi:hypothetical protein
LEEEEAEKVAVASVAEEDLVAEEEASEEETETVWK